MKEAIYDFLKRALVPFVIASTFYLVTQNILDWQTVCIIAGVLFIVLFLILGILPQIQAVYGLLFTAKFKGLWKNNNLQEQITKNYRKSNRIKIKVTRGFGLFYVKKGIYHQLFFDKKFDEKKYVQVLLHYPCLKSEHIINRSRANQKSIDEYIEDLFLVLKKFKQHTLDENQDEEISVRFYLTGTNDYRDWRYYVFESSSKDNMTLFFNHYNDDVPGAKSNMFKVKSGVNSLCDDLNRAFDSIYDDYSVELISNLKSSRNLVNSTYCGHPGCTQKIKEVYTKIFQHS